MHGFSAQPFHYGRMTAYVSKRCKSGIRPAAERIQPKARIELKTGDPEYERIKVSIECFGYAKSIIVNRDLTVVDGHQRLNVLKDLGYTEIEVAQVDLSKQEEKALNIALNKITGYWDNEKLMDLLSDLNESDFDLGLTGFDEPELSDLFQEQEEQEEKENARQGTVRHYNLQIFNETDTAGFWQMPIIENDGYIPKTLTGFKYAMSANDFDTTIHFFIDDYQFERLWNTPERYVDLLSKFNAVLSPDFSLYMNMPMAMKLWNIYRSRLLGHYWQEQGIKVIPTIGWAEPETFTFCFDGIPEKSIVAVSTVGVRRHEEAIQIWKSGMDAMIERLKPSVILVYGGELEYEYPKGIDVRYYENLVMKKLREETKRTKEL